MNKKAILASLLSLTLMGGAYGIWTNYFTGMSTLQVTSVNPVTYESFLDVNSLDVSTAGAVVTDKVTIHNGNTAILSLKASWVVTTVDVVDNCLVSEPNGITVTAFNGEVEMIQDYVLEVGPSMNRDIFIKYNVVRLACPSTTTVSLTFTPV